MYKLFDERTPLIKGKNATSYQAFESNISHDYDTVSDIPNRNVRTSHPLPAIYFKELLQLFIKKQISLAISNPNRDYIAEEIYKRMAAFETIATSDLEYLARNFSELTKQSLAPDVSSSKGSIGKNDFAVAHRDLFRIYRNTINFLPEVSDFSHSEKEAEIKRSSLRY